MMMKTTTKKGIIRGGSMPAGPPPPLRTDLPPAASRRAAAAAAAVLAASGFSVSLSLLLFIVSLAATPREHQGPPLRRLWPLCGTRICVPSAHATAPPPPPIRLHHSLHAPGSPLCVPRPVHHGGSRADHTSRSSSSSSSSSSAAPDTAPTGLSHIMFGIASSARSWPRRRDYVKLWWRGAEMRGSVWIDKTVDGAGTGDDLHGILPPLRVSEDTSGFEYTSKWPGTSRSAVRISRIVSETVELIAVQSPRDDGVRWLVMCDDDTVFVAENLVSVLGGLDHREMYYVGSTSESHLQNVALFSYNMAYGGGGFAVSYPLARALHAMQDGCLARNPALSSSDHRVQACTAELGVPLTRHPGFHQYDIYGNLLGLLAAHPIAPAISLHHLDIVDPIFPNMTRLGALTHLKQSMDADPAYFLQQSICYDKEKHWSISVSWGFAVQVYRGVFAARELELPARTFYNWHRRADYTAFAFNTRPFPKNPCQRPFTFYMLNITSHMSGDRVLVESNYIREDIMPPPACKWKMASPGTVQNIKVVKRKADNTLWSKGPRRKCCRVVRSGPLFMDMDVHDCENGEIAAI